MNITNELRLELLNHALDTLDNVDSMEDFHYHCFNEDDYIIGYYEAGKWIDKHFNDSFSAISELITIKEEVFGKTTSSAFDVTAETVANGLAYFAGETVLADVGLDDELTIEEARQLLTQAIDELNHAN